MKAEHSLALATANVSWRWLKNKNPKTKHMFQAVLRDFMSHPSRSGINMTCFLFIFCLALRSAPLHSGKCRIIYSTSQHRADVFSISMYLRFDVTHMGFLRVITLFFPNCWGASGDNLQPGLSETRNRQVAIVAQQQPRELECCARSVCLWKVGTIQRLSFSGRSENTLQCFKAQRVAAAFPPARLLPPCYCWFR